MLPPTPPLSPSGTELLLEHAAWMRRLARRLVRDPVRADELSQETWLRVLEHPPRLEGPLRGWIATVMRNLARMELRGSARRQSRERSTGRAESLPSSLDLLERAELQRELVQAVLELEEPYRSMILRRYFDERTPSQIAREVGLPLATVKTRLARGVARLRARLERREGPRGLSALAALAWIEPSPVPTPWSLSGISTTLLPAAVKAKLSLTVLLALAALGVSYLLSRDEGPLREEARAAPGTPSAEHASRGALGALEGAGQEPFRSAREASPARSRDAQGRTVTVGAALLHGRVLDSSGAPVAGAPVAGRRMEGPADGENLAARPGEPVLALADAEGRFELSTEAGHLQLFVADVRWATVLAGLPVTATRPTEAVVVVAPRIELAGEVLDGLGTPVAGARIDLEPPAGLRARLGSVLDYSLPVRWSTLTDERGRFSLPACPSLEEARLLVQAQGFEPRHEPAPLFSRSDLVLVLSPPPALRSRLEGRVVDPAGAPAAGARVSLGLDSTVSDDHGRFALELDSPTSFNQRLSAHLPVPTDHLVAVKPGYLPAELTAPRAGPRPGPEDDAEPPGSVQWPQPLVLRLGPPPLTLAGRVVDENGEALAGVQVWLADPTLFGGIEQTDSDWPQLVQTESLLAQAAPGWNWTESDAQGRFRLEGLLDREYVLAAMDPGTLLRSETAGVQAGRQDVRLELHREATFSRLRGRLVDSRGEPVPGALVAPMCDALRLKLAGEILTTHHSRLEGTTSDAEGRFELSDVPRDLVYLRIQGPDTIPLEWGRGVEGGLAHLILGDPQELEIRVERRCHFQVELAVPDEADTLGVLDEAGQPLVISEFLGNGRRDQEQHGLLEGRSNPLAVGDGARHLVLYKQGLEVRRLPLRLVPGELTTLRP